MLFPAEAPEKCFPIFVTMPVALPYPVQHFSAPQGSHPSCCGKPIGVPGVVPSDCLLDTKPLCGHSAVSYSSGEGQAAHSTPGGKESLLPSAIFSALVILVESPNRQQNDFLGPHSKAESTSYSPSLYVCGKYKKGSWVIA